MGDFHLISGDDEQAIKRGSRRIICGICGDPPENHPDLEIIGGGNEQKKDEDILRDLINSLLTPPFLSPRKILWLRHFGGFGGAKPLAAVKERLQELADLLVDGLPPELSLVVDGPGVDRRSAFFKKFKALGEIHWFEAPKPNDRNYERNVRETIEGICREAGKRLSPAAARFLVEAVGGQFLAAELEKIFCYVGESAEVGIDDCRAVVSPTPEALGWEFTNALCDRDAVKAMAAIGLLVEQMRGGRGGYGLELSLLASAVNCFQNMIEAKSVAQLLGVAECRDSGRFEAGIANAPPEIAAKHGEGFLFKAHPYRAFKIVRGAANFSDEELAMAIGSLLETNRKLVSGGAPPRLALEQLTLAICGGLGGRPGRRH